MFTGLSSWRIFSKILSCLVWFLWWLRQGAIGPIEATLFRVTVDWPDFWIYTFELEIRLSKVKQLAFLFCTISVMSRWSFGPRVPRRNSCLPREAVRNSQKLRFYCSFSLWDETWHERQKATGMSFSCRCGLFGFWWGQTYCAPNSMELEKPLYALWADLTTVPARE